MGTATSKEEASPLAAYASAFRLKDNEFTRLLQMMAAGIITQQEARAALGLSVGRNR